MSQATSPFHIGQLVQDEAGISYRVTQACIESEPGTVPRRCFELVRVTPPQPFQQAMSLADRYRSVVESPEDRTG
jgi:hypothetical protein